MFAAKPRPKALFVALTPLDSKRFYTLLFSCELIYIKCGTDPAAASGILWLHSAGHAVPRDGNLRGYNRKSLERVMRIELTTSTLENSLWMGSRCFYRHCPLKIDMLSFQRRLESSSGVSTPLKDRIYFAADAACAGFQLPLE